MAPKFKNQGIILFLKSTFLAPKFKNQHSIFLTKLKNQYFWHENCYNWQKLIFFILFQVHIVVWLTMTKLPKTFAKKFHFPWLLAFWLLFGSCCHFCVVVEPWPVVAKCSPIAKKKKILPKISQKSVKNYTKSHRLLMYIF